MNLSQLEEAGKNVEAKLIKIREDLSAPIGDYHPRALGIEIPGETLLEMVRQSPGEPILINEQVSMVYIRDHIFQANRCGYYEKNKSHPADCFLSEKCDYYKEIESGCFRSGYKVHFYLCDTLEKMRIKKRMPRYRVESKFVNEHVIDISDSVKRSVRLALCQNCIKEFASKAGRASMKREDIFHIAGYGDAEKLMKCVDSLYKNKPFAKEDAWEFIVAYKHAYPSY